MDLDIILTVTSIGVAAVTSVVGIWIERDPSRTKTIAYILSGLIIMASFVSIAQSYIDERAKQKMEADLARMLVMLNQIADQEGGESSELQALIKSELNTQSRNNPNVINKVAQRISDNGGDPSRTLRGYLPKAEVESLSRRGTLRVKKTVAKKRTIKTPQPTSPKTLRKRTTTTPAKSARTQPIRLKSPTTKRPVKSTDRPKRTVKAKTQSLKRKVNDTQTRAKSRFKDRANQAKAKTKRRVNRAKNKAKNKAKNRANRAKNRAKNKAKQKLKGLGL